MKNCDKCKDETWILICEHPANTEEVPADGDPKEVWVCPDCYLLDQGDKEFDAAMRQAGIDLGIRSYVH